MNPVIWHSEGYSRCRADIGCYIHVTARVLFK